MRTATVRIRNLTKAFSGKVVLGPLDLDLFTGDFVALLGHNGAGKSTLIKILDAVYTADDGTIDVVGTDTKAGSVAVVHQDLGLVDSMSVLDNLRLGRKPLRHRLGYLDRQLERTAATEALERFGLTFSLDTYVRDLAPSERALLAVARVAVSQPRLIVLDETTSILSSADASRLIATLRANSPADITFVMVTHKLDEALTLANRVVVLRDGALVCDRRVPLPSLDEITLLLAPHAEQQAGSAAADGEFAADPLLEFRDVRLGGLGPVSFTVHRGEALAVTGRMGSSLPAVGYLAAGSVAPDDGQVWLRPGARAAIVPPDREREGNLPDLTVRENATTGSLHRWRQWRIPGLLRPHAERAAAATAVSSLGVIPASIAATQCTLSGGNQQKVIFSRALLTEPDLFVLCEPTRGVDIVTRLQLYGLMADLKARGCGLLVVASDPHDVLAVSDRILVIDDGTVTAAYQAADLTTAALARLV
jgi:ribose transport system ATP-binding protein